MLQHSTCPRQLLGTEARRLTSHVLVTRKPIEHSALLRRSLTVAASSDKLVWVQTQESAVLTSAVEAGINTFLFPEASAQMAADWQGLANFQALHIHKDMIQDQEAKQVGHMSQVTSAEDMQKATAYCDQPGFFVLDCTDWQIIPAENMVATFQDKPARLLGMVKSAAEGRVMLEALEAGTAGVVLNTEDPLQVRELAAYIRRRNAAQNQLKLEVAHVTKVQQVGMGDRVCVDMCSMLVPGEGMLVGNFARAGFLVHSECTESRYINSRPFRVNAGPVHAYTAGPEGRTAYLAELHSGQEVLVVNHEGQQRSAIVGRVKIESRPLVLVEAATDDGLCHSLLLQNAETVRLIGPADTANVSSSTTSDQLVQHKSEDKIRQPLYRAVAVTELQIGQTVYLHMQDAARHTGISINETIIEK